MNGEDSKFEIACFFITYYKQLLRWSKILQFNLIKIAYLYCHSDDPDALQVI